MPRENRRVRLVRPRDRCGRRRPTRPAEHGHGVDVAPRRQMRAGAMFERVTARIARHERDRLRRALRRALPRASPARRAAPRRRPAATAPTTSASAPSTASTAEAASARRGALMRAIPNTVAAMRNGMTAATLWYRGIGHRAEVREPVREKLRQRDGREARREHEEEQERKPEPDEIGDVVRLERARRGSTPGSVKSIRTTPVRRAADLVVEAVEDAARRRENVRHDDVDGDERPRRARERRSTAPASRRPARARTRCPSAAIGSPMSSPVDIASSAQTANGTSRSVSRNQMQKRKSGIANVTGWIDAAALVADPRVREVAEREEPGRRARSRGAAGRARTRAARRARRRRSARSASASGDGQITHSGASSARNGSTWPPRRTICSPVAPCVTSSGRPCAVLQTACTMFPRSNRPSRKFT